MEQKDARTIQQALAQPFAPEDLEWRLQQTEENGKWGLAIPYVTNRAIQARLDDVVGVDGWYNDYRPWHGAGKKEAQICGISIRFPEQGFITKWDGAEDSDIEPIKGGLSDSMKRAAVQWGIGRCLYGMDAIFVDVEKRGRSWIIKKTERPKLDKAYMDYLSKLKLTAAPAGGMQSTLTPKQTKEAPTPNTQPAPAPVQPMPQPKTEDKAGIYTVIAARLEKRPNSTTHVLLERAGGEQLHAFAMGDHPELLAGTQLTGVKLAMRQQYQPKFTQEIAQANARVQELGRQYQRENQILKAFVPGTSCPTCRRPVTEENLSEVQGAIQTAINHIIANGRSQRIQVAQLQEQEAKDQAVFDQFQADDIIKMQDEIDALTRQRDKLTEDRQADKLREQIQQLSASLEYGNLSQQEYDRLLACRDELQQCAAELAAAQKAAEQEQPDFDTQIAQVQQEVKNLKVLISNVVIYARKRAELTFEALKMNQVAISLYDVMKTTGEQKAAFKFTYNGRRYDRLSLSEKIRAGMEVSELVKRLTGRNYPVFVDNMESVDDLANVRPTGQVIMAKCVHGAPLEVRPLRPIPAAAEQKAA